MMQPYIPQALVAARIAEMHQEAESARLARQVRRARRLASLRLAPVRPLRTAAPVTHPERAGLPAGGRTERAGRPAA
jgi:hypothetical protein